MSWIDKLLGIGSTPDWITPLKGIADDIQHGGSLFQSSDNDIICFHRSVSVNEAKRRLKNAGIEHWNDYIDGDYGYITVPKGQGTKASEVISG